MRSTSSSPRTRCCTSSTAPRAAPASPGRRPPARGARRSRGLLTGLLGLSAGLLGLLTGLRRDVDLGERVRRRGGGLDQAGGHRDSQCRCDNRWCPHVDEDRTGTEGISRASGARVPVPGATRRGPAPGRATTPDASTERSAAAPTFVTIFPDRDALIRLVGAVLAEQHDEWTEGRRYLGLDVLSRARLTAAPDPTTSSQQTSPSNTLPALSA